MLARERIPEAEYTQLDAAFQRAWEGCPDLRRSACVLLADHPVRLRVAGRTLAGALLRAFAHLRAEPPPPPTDYGLTIDMWDEAETGIGVDGLRPRSDLDAPGETFVSADGRIVVTARAQTRTALDRRRRHIVGWVGRSDRFTQYETGRPLHSELMLWHRDRDVLAIHAGLVARGDDGVLLGGPGGSGKSTTALTCFTAGFRYLADDHVGVRALPGGGFVGHSLYCSTHLAPAQLEHFPDLRPFAIPGTLPREDKCLVLLSDLHHGELARTARIRAVALPRVVDSDTTGVRPASTVGSMLRLAPSSLRMLLHVGAAAGAFDQLGRFLESVPTYWLELGRDLGEIPKRVEEILEKHA